VLDSGRLVLQDQLAHLEQPTGRVLVATDDPERAVALLDGLVERRDGTELLVKSDDAAALNARLVEAGVPVRSLAAQRRTLEEIVLDVTGSGSDEFGVAGAEGSATMANGTDTANGAPTENAEEAESAATAAEVES
jgi:ABC-2 type transport system ATP-binding protein